MRTLVGRFLIKLGVAILPIEVRQMVRDLLMYNVPGAVAEQRKDEIRAAAKASRRS